MTRLAGGTRPNQTAKRLPSNHPAYDLVSQRAFEDMREVILTPRPIRRPRLTGSGSASIYPPGTRAQVERVLELKRLGVEANAQIRILLWLEDFPMSETTVKADLQEMASIVSLAASVGPTAADHVIMQMVHAPRPTSLVRWASRLVPDRQRLEDAFVQMSQLALGARPADLMLDDDAARPLHSILTGMFPDMPEDVNRLVEVFDDPDFNDFIGEAASFGSWTIDEWREARDVQRTLPLEPPTEIRGEEYFAFRFSRLLASGAWLRHESREKNDGTVTFVANDQEAS